MSSLDSSLSLSDINLRWNQQRSVWIFTSAVFGKRFRCCGAKLVELGARVSGREPKNNCIRDGGGDWRWVLRQWVWIARHSVPSFRASSSIFDCHPSEIILIIIEGLITLLYWEVLRSQPILPLLSLRRIVVLSVCDVYISLFLEPVPVLQFVLLFTHCQHRQI